MRMKFSGYNERSNNWKVLLLFTEHKYIVKTGLCLKHNFPVFELIE